MRVIRARELRVVEQASASVYYQTFPSVLGVFCKRERGAMGKDTGVALVLAFSYEHVYDFTCE